MNDIYLGDCLDVLSTIQKNSVDLIYLDPPFFTQRNQTLQTRDGARKYTFEDTWESPTDYRVYIQSRLSKCRDVLSDSGSIFLHCDRSASHHLRIALDETFGPENFQSEIIWFYRRWSNAKKGLLNTHQVIFFYSKSNAFKFIKTYDDYSPTTNIDQILQKRSRDGRGKAIYKTDSAGKSILMNDKKGVPLSDVWEIPYLNPKAKERVGYPTQKPILLLEKIIDLVTDENDVVLDPFCGSGTTLVAAKLKNRRFIGIDQSKDAITLTRQRLNNPIRTESALLRNGISSYKNQNDITEQLLKSIGAIVVQRNKGIDGFVRTIDGLVPVKVQKSGESFEEASCSLIKASRKNNYPKKVLLVGSEEIDSHLLDQRYGTTLSDNGILIVNSATQLVQTLGLKAVS